MDRAIIRVKVVPRSSRDQICGVEGPGIFRIKLKAPPVEGRANKALRTFLAKRLGISVGDVEILSGGRSRQKTLQIRGLSETEILSVLRDSAVGPA
jgi:uncharacterized protein (TIGR00251 family)